MEKQKKRGKKLNFLYAIILTTVLLGVLVEATVTFKDSDDAININGATKLWVNGNLTINGTFNPNTLQINSHILSDDYLYLNDDVNISGFLNVTEQIRGSGFYLSNGTNIFDLGGFAPSTTNDTYVGCGLSGVVCTLDDDIISTSANISTSKDILPVTNSTGYLGRNILRWLESWITTIRTDFIRVNKNITANNYYIANGTNLFDLGGFSDTDTINTTKAVHVYTNATPDLIAQSIVLTNGSEYSIGSAAAAPAITLIKRGYQVLSNITFAFDENYTYINFTADQLTIGDRIRVHVWGYNNGMSASEQVRLRVEAKGVTSPGYIRADHLISNTNQTFAFEQWISQDTTYTDKLLSSYRTLYQTTLVDGTNTLDTGDTNVFKTEWALMLNFKYATLAKGSTNISYAVYKYAGQ